MSRIFNIRVLAALALLAATAGHAQTFTVTPASGPGPFTVAWNVAGGTNCQAAGISAWTGAVAAQGTKAVSPGTGSKTLTLVCSVPGDPTKGSGRVTWQPATQNTDGSFYTNAKDVLVYAEQVSPPNQQVAAVPLDAGNGYEATGLTAGEWFFAAKSRSTLDATSDFSNIVALTIADVPTTRTWTGTQTINVTAPPAAKPKAPVLSEAP